MGPSGVEDIYILSPMQEGMLHHSLRAPGSGLYVEQMHWAVRGPLDSAAFRESWERTARRHPILRSAVVWEKRDRPLQVVYRQPVAPWMEEDWRDLSPQEQHERLERHLASDRVRGFDFAVAPLMRFALIRLANDTVEFVWSFHHLLLDGWSAALVLDDVARSYAALRSGEAPVSRAGAPYRAYIAWLQRQDRSRAEAFWCKELDGVAGPTQVPIDFAEGATTPTESGDHREVVLSRAVTETVLSFARRNQLTLNSLVLGAWGSLLARYSASEEVLFGSTVSGRPAELADVDGSVGLFINTLPVRVRLSPWDEVAPWLRSVQRGFLESQAFAYAPLTDIHGWSGIPRGVALFESIVVLENYPELEPRSGAAIFDLDIGRARSLERTNYPLVLVVTPGPQLVFRLAFDSGRYAVPTIDRMLSCFVRVMEGVVSDPDRRVAEIPLLTGVEREGIVVGWNATRREYPRDRSLGELFEEQVRLRPEAVALVEEGRSWTYGELGERSRMLARRLMRMGVGAETRVGLWLDRSFEMVVGMLGIVRAGGAYVPLDPSYPLERLRWMAADAGVGLVLVRGEASARAELGGSVRIVSVGTVSEEGDDEEREEGVGERRARVCAETLAYVMYTSGSTGRPKGVGVAHRGVVRLVKGADYASLGSEEVFLQLAPISFDASVLEIWGSLLNGGRLVVMPSGAPSLEELGRAVERYGVTTLWLTAPLFHQMVEGHLGSLRGVRQLLSGGDVLWPRHVERVRRELPGCRMINGYGPTEGTTFACCHTVVEERFEGRSVPIGRPIANTRAYVLDGRMEPVPVGVPGELYLGGDGLARGYLGDAALTAERFVPDAVGAEAGGRLYKTGDRARYLEDGRLEFLGRLDEQVKIRGYRIEPGEIEEVLGSHPGVKGAAVVVREGDEGAGTRRLVAYVVPGSPDEIDGRSVREFLRERLPEYMVPSQIVMLEELPLTPSGKVDRLALPREEGAGEGRASAGARTPVEEMVAGIWSRVLGVERIGLEESFFELGGHSLLATQVISRVREAFRVELPMRWLFERPTVAGLATRIEELLRDSVEGSVPAIRPVSREGPLPLSFAQERLWFLDQLEPGSASYNVPMAVRMEGRLEEGVLARAFGEVMRRHEALRTRFAVVDGTPIQVIEEARGFPVAVEDLRGVREEEREEALRLRVSEEGSRPFDLTQGPLMRALLLRMGQEEHVLVVVLHHIVSDGWSLGVLVREMAELYGAYVRGERSPLPELPVQYADFAVWQRSWLQGTTLASQLAYWKDKLGGAPAVLDLPSDRLRRAVRSLRGARRSFEFPDALASTLEELARREGATVFMVLLAAFDVLLHRYGRLTDIVVGTPIAGRNRVEIEGLIGFFVNTLVLRTDLSGDPSFRETVHRVRDVALGAHAHQDVPFEKLVEALQPERNLSTTPIFQVLFDVQNTPMPRLEIAGLTLSPHEVTTDTAQFDLSMSLTRTAEGFSGTVDFDTDLFEGATIERMTAHFRRLLEGATADPECRISRLPLLTEPERRLLLAEWNDPRASVAGASCLHELFGKQAARTPDAVAASFEDESITYRELDRRSTVLARRLRAAGVRLEAKVALFLDRSVEMLVAILGTLKAGGAYVPLDPDYPDERLAFMLEDSGAVVVVTRRSIEDHLPPHSLPIVCVDSEASIESGTAGEFRVFPESAAYVIYTSGSTGRPKGVEVSHANVARIFEATAPWFRFDSADTWSLFHSFAFDVSVWEMWGALLHGGRLVLVPEDTRRDPEAFRSLLERERVTVLCQTPSSFRGLAEMETSSRTTPLLEALRLVIFAGEALSPPSLRPWLDRYGDQRPALINMYGITETTIHASYRHVTLQDLEAGAGSVVGIPISDLRIHLLDSSLQLVPVGVTGEIFVGGAGLARGYLGRPDLTAERFVPDPFGARRGERLYRSGDLARRLPNGEIEYLGRSDHQVKIRGFRVEPAEVESTLLVHPAVREAVVLAREGGSGDRRLVAYLVGVPRERPASSALREFLGDRLPDYMVPAVFVWLEAWPITPNGKLDRSALPDPDRDDSVPPEGFVGPESPVEEVLTAIWREVLALDRVGVHDDFFDLGGHSLLAAQVLHRMRDAFRTELPLRSMFETPTVAGLARALLSSERIPGISDKIARLRRAVDAMPADEVRRRLEETERERDLA